jgi:PAS domain S-box-containing protein
VLESEKLIRDYEFRAPAPSEPNCMRDWLLNCYPVKDSHGVVLGINTVVQDITESKKVEQFTQQIQRDLMFTLEHTNDLFYAVDRNWRLTYLNQRTLEAAGGLSRSQLIGRNLWEALPKMIDGTMEADLRKAMAAQSDLHFETQSIANDRWYEYSVYPSADGLSFFGRDVTERNRARSALGVRLHELEIVHNLNADVVQAHELETIYTRALDAVREAVAADRASLLLFDEDRVMRFKAWHGLSASYRRAVDGHSPWSYGQADPSPIVIPDVASDESLAQYHPIILQEGIQALAFIPLTYEGKLIGKFMLYFDRPRGLTQDEVRLIQTIANHVSMAIEHQRAEQILRESEERYRLLSEITSDYIFAYHRQPDGTFKIAWISDAFQRITGYRPDEVATRNDWGKMIYPEDRKLIQEFMDQMHANQRHVVEHRILVKNGDIRWLRIFGQPIWDEAEGQVVRILGAGQDITERKQAEADRERLLQELAKERAQLEVRVQRRTRQVRSLAAKLSLAEHQERKRVAQILHDHVQQMLYGVQWRSHLIEFDLSADSSDAVRTHLSAIRDLAGEAVRAARTLTVELSPPVLENEGLPEAVSWLGNHMKELHNLQVITDVHTDCRGLNKSLQVLLFQVVRELLFNVIKHAKASQAFVTLHCQEGQIVVMVRDEGQGFDVETVSTTDDVRTGFGLSSIQERLSLFDGRLNIHSAPGQGTQTTVTLPLAVK